MKNKGFTLIELLVVIAIIGLLSSVIFASLNSARTKARDAKRMSELGQMAKAFELYYDTNGSYPSDTNATWSSWAGWAGIIPSSYIVKVPVDPINRDIGNCQSVQNCLLYRYCRLNGGQGYVLIANLENPLSKPMGNNPSCSHGGPNHFWIQGGN